MKFCRYAGAASVLFLFIAYGLGSHAPHAAQAAEAASSTAQPKAVEEDMHEFMEYVFQPTYVRLKKSMAAEPADKAGWTAIKADALILAEGGNLLLIRGPEENAKAWAEHSVAVRDFGGKFYDAAKEKDFAAAQQNYKSMLTHCNACHNDFADGEHQVSP